MKTLTLTIVILAQVFTNASCQKEKSVLTTSDSIYYPFVKENTIWKIRYATQKKGEKISYIIAHGDTLIDFVRYKKFYASTDSITLLSFHDSSFWGVMREKDKKVYYYGFKHPIYFYNIENPKERLLYDFSLKMGNIFLDETGRQWEVIKTDSILIGNKYRKRWKLCNSIDCVRGYYNKDIWIEGIGSTFGVFPGRIESHEVLSNLICYTETEKDVVQCDFLDK